jgi:hypothetical protein
MRRKTMPDEEELRERAYALWEKDGRPDGRHDDHWHRAHEELSQDIVDDLGAGTIEPDGQPAAGAAVESNRDDEKASEGGERRQK